MKQEYTDEEFLNFPSTIALDALEYPDINNQKPSAEWDAAFKWYNEFILNKTHDRPYNLSCKGCYQKVYQVLFRGKDEIIRVRRRLKEKLFNEKIDFIYNKHKEKDTRLQQLLIYLSEGPDYQCFAPDCSQELKDRFGLASSDDDYLFEGILSYIEDMKKRIEASRIINVTIPRDIKMNVLMETKEGMQQYGTRDQECHKPPINPDL